MADLSERLQAALAHRYQIERVLGHGGMATVYLARDLKEPSRRFVAIKVLPPESALAVRTSRFLREITIAGQLTHTGILPLHESGEVDGFFYYVMPFVEGASLRERLASGPLRISEAIRIASEVAEALDYAHRSGIVHRDITPTNLLFIEDHPVIADFGIARGLDPPRDAEITDKGGVIGTPAYMSPEQIRASEVDARSDIYSLACVLYEMLDGRPPFVGPTGDAVRAQHVADPVPPLKRRGVPSSVTTTIARALAKHPDDRYQTAAEFRTALGAEPEERVSIRRVTAVAAGLSALVVVGVLAAAAPREWWKTGDVSPPSVAVLPFVNMSGSTVHDYFGEGMTEELINALQLDGLRVVPRTTASAFRDSTLDIREIGRRLSVDNVLEASFRIEGDSLRIVARLIKVADGFPVWSRSFDREVRRIVELQRDLAWAIVGGLRVRLRGDETALIRQHTQNAVAYDYYLQGRYFWNRRSPQAIAKAIEYFQLAITHDSTYALAYSGLADAHVLAGQYNYLPRDQTFAQARAAATRALELDESLAEAHTSLAKVYQAYDWNWQGAEREYLRAIELNPRYALARTWYAMLLGRGMARHDEAIRQALAGWELDTLSPWANNNVSVVMNHARRHDEAIRFALRAVKWAPEWPTAHGQLAQSYRWRGKYAEALAEYAIASRLGPRTRDAYTSAAIYARTGRRAEALAVLAQLQERSRRDPVWVDLALLYVSLGDNDRALDALDSAITRRSFPFEPTLASSPDWDPLRSDPRFAALLRRTGVPP